MLAGTPPRETPAQLERLRSVLKNYMR